MGTATTPAQQAREVARENLLKGIRQKVTELEQEVGKCSLHRIFLRLLDKRLSPKYNEAAKKELCEALVNDIFATSMKCKKRAFKLFCEMSKEIKDFQRSEEEGRALFSELLVWTAGEIARPHRVTLDVQDIQNQD